MLKYAKNILAFTPLSISSSLNLLHSWTIWVVMNSKKQDRYFFSVFKIFLISTRLNLDFNITFKSLIITEMVSIETIFANLNQ